MGLNKLAANGSQNSPLPCSHWVMFSPLLIILLSTSTMIVPSLSCWSMLTI
ncbi:hypothetical protein Patl1_15423 [Pistacia atlantica]|uniref:Uncharacterized protein n=1 Tax=Pistacia atlantica TaxID=434234 RepID=A0ACC1BA87_9ROSI|nr:hypothetical protein Patl1_15423 [Pistacia atlantica]